MRIHLPINLTTRALAALIGISQSAVDRITWWRCWPAHSRPAPDNSNHPWIIDATLIPVHDQSITAISKNYRPSINTQITICARRCRVVVVDSCRPANRNDVIVARATVAHLLTGRQASWATAATAASPRSSPRDATTAARHPRRHRPGAPPDQRPHPTGHRPAKDWHIPRQCRRRCDAINHSHQIITGLWNLKTRKQLRVNS